MARATHIRNSQSSDNSSWIQIPKPQSVRMLDTKRWLQDGYRNKKIRSKNEVLVPIDANAVEAKFSSHDVKGFWKIFWNLMNNIEICISFNKASGKSPNGRYRSLHWTLGFVWEILTAHVDDQEAPKEKVCAIFSRKWFVKVACPSGLGWISSVMDDKRARLLFLKAVWYVFEASQ